MFLLKCPLTLFESGVTRIGTILMRPIFQKSFEYFSRQDVADVTGKLINYL